MASFLFYFVIVLAVVGTGAVVLAVRQTNRFLRAVAQATCVSCGGSFELETARAAKTDFDEAFQKVLQENLGWRVNPKREWPVECPTCGAPHKYLLDEQKILLEEVDVEGRGTAAFGESRRL